ncbi:hypothetical protein [Shinella zoogloeoides]
MKQIICGNMQGMAHIDTEKVELVACDFLEEVAMPFHQPNKSYGGSIERLQRARVNIDVDVLACVRSHRPKQRQLSRRRRSVLPY